MNKDIIKYCENFYEIINFEPMGNDVITEKMIVLYKKYIFGQKVLDEKTIENIINLDKAMKKYIDDCLFRKDMQKCIINVKVQSGVVDYIKLFIDKIVDFFVNYSVYTTRVVYVSKWI